MPICCTILSLEYEKKSDYSTPLLPYLPEQSPLSYLNGLVPFRKRLIPGFYDMNKGIDNILHSVFFLIPVGKRFQFRQEDHFFSK